jgi:hypothetical protein
MVNIVKGFISVFLSLSDEKRDRLPASKFLPIRVEVDEVLPKRFNLGGSVDCLIGGLIYSFFFV